MLEFDLKIRSRDIGTLVNSIQANDSEADVETVKRAYYFAEEVHKKDFRLSGEPYIIHPLEVALILSSLKMDIQTITAALLHDVVEDTEVNLDTISEKFSKEIADLVDGVTKISSIKNRSKTVAQAETLRKMLLATIKDVRVIIIKLADKLHNMRTIMFQSPEKQLAIAKETLDIYAPIAKRLGISAIAAELEDLSFVVIHRDEYNSIQKKLQQKQNEIQIYIETVKEILQNKLSELNISAEITGRAKHYFSIFRKMKQQNKDFDEIFDIRAIRVIADEIKDCYGILGVIHTLWTPIDSRFKDYIAVPKSNMYQSLHTTVIGPGGFPLEVQIRTEEMHATAEIGIASHWLYKESNKRKKRDHKNHPLIKDINRLQADISSPMDFLTGIKMDLYEDEIFVFTPRGKIMKLAAGATPVDFAYAIHTEVGHHTVGAKINNRIMPLKTKLNSGDIVEILTSKKGHPSESWLKFVVSSNARYKIRSYLRKQKKTEFSAQVTDKTAPPPVKRPPKEAPSIEVTIPQNETEKLDKLKENNVQSLSIEGESNLLIKLSQCCQPIPGDDVIGFITRGRGITVHKKTCPSLQRLSAEKERFINIVWKESSNTYPVKIAVHATDRPGLLKDITDEISQADTNIIKAEANVKDKSNADFKFTIEVKSNDHLNKIITKLKKIKNITDVSKLNEKVMLNR